MEGKCPNCKHTFKKKLSIRKYCSSACYHAFRSRPKTHKVCTHCLKKKTRSEFFNGISANGTSWCKVCYLKRQRTKYKYECIGCGLSCKRTQKHDPKSFRCSKCDRAKRLSDNGGVSHNYNGTAHFAGGTFAAWKCSAKRRGYAWKITKNQVEKKFMSQGGICALSGTKMIPKSNSPFRPSIDRIDSSNGYVMGNFQFVCSMVNMMKNKFDQNEFIDMCNKISKHRRANS